MFRSLFQKQAANAEALLPAWVASGNRLLKNSDESVTTVVNRYQAEAYSILKQYLLLYISTNL